MTSECQFWLNWFVNVAIAAGTIGAVIVALFGGWLRATIAPPKLVLSLVDPRGEHTKIQLVWQDEQGEQKTRVADSRWYRVRILNSRRWSPATNVQVYLTRIEEPDPTGELRTKWIGEAPLQWTNTATTPLAPTLGHALTCNLCSIVEEKWFELHPLVSLAALDARRNKSTDLVVTLQARGIETDSNFLRMRLTWDGRWKDGSEEMTQHMVVKIVS